jgi:hypothetical protein
LKQEQMARKPIGFLHCAISQEKQCAISRTVTNQNLKI